MRLEAQISRFQIRAYLFLALYTLVFWTGVLLGFTLNGSSCWFYSNLSSEGSFSELCTLVFYCFAMIGFNRLYVKHKRYIYLALLCLSFLIFMEEISWGVVALESKGFGVAHREFSLHYLFGLQKVPALFEFATWTLYIFLFLYFSSVSLISRSYIFLLASMPLLLKAAVFVFLKFDFIPSCGLKSYDEIGQLLLAYSLFFVACLELIRFSVLKGSSS